MQVSGGNENLQIQVGKGGCWRSVQLEGCHWQSYQISQTAVEH